MDTDLQIKETPIRCNDEGLLCDFLCEVSLQAKTLEILEGMDKGNAALCTRLNDELLLCKKEISTLKDVCEMQKQELKEQQALSSKIEELNKFIDHIENNIPPHFTYVPSLGDDTQLSYEDDDGSDNGYEDSCSSASPNRPSIAPVRLFAGSSIQSPVGNGIHSPLVEQKDMFEMQTPFQGHHLPKPVCKVVDTKFCPTVAYLTQEEFDSIPSYMKGRTRLSYDSVNIFIDTFNAALKKKYKIVSQRATNLRLQEKQLHMKYKTQENKETKGMYFITEEDMKNSGQVTALNTVNSLMSILRSCRRMYEVRGGGLVRFVVNTGN